MGWLTGHRTRALVSALLYAVTVSLQSPASVPVGKGSHAVLLGDPQVYRASGAHLDEAPRDAVTASAPTPTGMLPGGGGPLIASPFASAVPVSSSFGPRAAPCRGCSTDHRGLDLLAGDGAEVGAVAAGRVVAAGYHPSFGYRVILEHRVDGRTVRSLSAHMRAGSLRVVTGQEVALGDTLGLVGATGQVTGPHLHLEIEVEGSQVDPDAYLRAGRG